MYTVYYYKIIIIVYIIYYYYIYTYRVIVQSTAQNDCCPNVEYAQKKIHCARSYKNQKCKLQLIKELL